MRHTEAQARVEVRSLTRVYVQNGFPNREAYLDSLAVYFDLSIDDVFTMATELGATKDFTTLLDKCQARKEQIELALLRDQNDPRVNGAVYREGWE